MRTIGLAWGRYENNSGRYDVIEFHCYANEGAWLIMQSEGKVATIHHV